jgi:hypothetical protein
MWKPEHRRAALRKGLRYPNDVTDEEWALIAPLKAFPLGRARSLGPPLSSGAPPATSHQNKPKKQKRYGLRLE